MSFLTENDYDVQIRNEIKAVIAQTDASLALAEQMAESEMSSYLRVRGYNIPEVFCSENRNALIVMYMIDITLYHLHSNIVTRAMPKTREDRYNAAISWLDKVSSGKLNPNLPVVETEGADATPLFKLGSQKKYSKRY